MKLGELIAGQELRQMEGDAETEITGLSYDSRQTRPGDLYFSLARDAARGQANVSDALSRGARAVAVRGWDGAATRPANFDRMRAAAPVDGRGRFALLCRAERAPRSDRRDRHQRQDHDHLSARLDFRSGRRARRDHRHGRHFRGRPQTLQRPHHSRVARFRARARRDGARERPSRGGGGLLDRNRGGPRR